MTVYGEAAYRAAKAVLADDVWWCWHGCGRRATTPDHVPPLAEHHHVPASGCCQLRPSCGPCNLATGAATGNRARRRRRVAPGSGWTR